MESECMYFKIIIIYIIPNDKIILNDKIYTTLINTVCILIIWQHAFFPPEVHVTCTID